MAVVGVRPIHDGQSGPKTDGGRQFVVRFRVEVDDPQDGTNVVLGSGAVALGLPTIGLPFSFGNDSYTAAICKSLDPNRVAGTRLLWEVEATFETPSFGGRGSGGSGTRPDEDGNETDDPDDWRAGFDVSHYIWSGPLERAILRTNLPGYRSAGSEGPVTNSARTPFDPPQEVEYAQAIIRITKTGRTFPNSLLPHENAINDDTITVVRGSYSRSFEPYTLKLNPIEASFSWHTTQEGDVVPYFTYTIEMHQRRVKIAPNFTLTWRFDLLDRGFQQRVHVGEEKPNGDGSPGSYYTAADLEESPTRQILDANDEPITEPVFLDLNGKPTTEPHYITYSHYPEVAFNHILAGIL